MPITDPAKRKFRWVMSLCGVFIIAMLGSLIYVCSRPQTAETQAAERRAIMACRQQSEEVTRTEIFRSERRKACVEMEKQYMHKFQDRP